MEHALHCEHIRKEYGGSPVLEDVTLTLDAGTVNVIAGENGAGKSTLLKIIAGYVAPERGTVSIFGTAVTRYDPLVSRQLGVSLIPQELLPLPDMTLEENLMLGREPRGRFGLVRRREMREQTEQQLRAVHLDLDPDTPMRLTSIATMQLVEILKATNIGAKLILMDEPTSSLSEVETQELFRIIHSLKERGTCIIYTTHRLSEIEAIGDTVAIMRDGHLISHNRARDMTQETIIRQMVGREIVELFPARMNGKKNDQDVLLAVKDLHVQGREGSNSFVLHRGEVLGFAGLIGAGRSETLEGLYGLRQATGQLFLNGSAVPLGDPSTLIANGIVMVPEDRKRSGLVMSMSILDNVSLPHLAKLTHHRSMPLIDNARREEQVRAAVSAVKLKFGHLIDEVSRLSGGNQQKVVLAKWLLGDIAVLILDEPTRGIDIGARQELYSIISSLASNGVGVVLASSDMTELLGLSDRVLVFRKGVIVAELDRREANQETVLAFAAGLRSTQGKKEANDIAEPVPGRM